MDKDSGKSIQAGEQEKELRITYILTHSNKAVSYFRNDPSWIAIYPKMMSLLTPQILTMFLHEALGISVSESITEAILAYPQDNNIEKDVTVVFRY